MMMALFLGLAIAGSEPLVWTKMADPDPTFVEPKRSKSKRNRQKSARGRTSEPTTLQGALINLAMVARERNEAAVLDYRNQMETLRAATERAQASTQAAEDSPPR